MLKRRLVITNMDNYSDSELGASFHSIMEDCLLPSTLSSPLHWSRQMWRKMRERMKMSVTMVLWGNRGFDVVKPKIHTNLSCCY